MCLDKQWCRWNSSHSISSARRGCATSQKRECQKSEKTEYRGSERQSTRMTGETKHEPTETLCSRHGSRASSRSGAQNSNRPRWRPTSPREQREKTRIRYTNPRTIAKRCRERQVVRSRCMGNAPILLGRVHQGIPRIHAGRRLARDDCHYSWRDRRKAGRQSETSLSYPRGRHVPTEN